MTPSAMIARMRLDFDTYKKNNGEKPIEVQELDDWLKQFEKVISKQEEQKAQHRELMEHHRALCAADHQNALQYNTVVVGAGYAAFLTIAAMIKESIDPLLLKWSLLTMGVSIFIFVIAEVCHMAERTRKNRKRANIYKGPIEDFDQRRRAREEELNADAITEIPIYHFNLWTTLAFGAAGFSLLVWAIIEKVIRA